MALLQPADIVDRRIGSHFNAAVIAVDGLVATDLSILETIGLLLGDEDLDILAQRALIAFEREDVIGLVINDLLGDVALTAHGIDAHDRALNRQQIQQFGDRDDFVRLLRHFDLPEHEALARREGRVMWIGAFAPFFW